MKLYKYIIRGFLMIIPGIILTGCIDEYWPEIGVKYDDALVVDGMITNNPGPYTVRLSLSSTVDDPVYRPYSGCAVTISDDKGNEEMLTEEVYGKYMTSFGGIQGEIGTGYKISIITPEGVHYNSDFEKLQPSTGIDTIYHELEYREVSDGLHAINGVQFYITTNTAEQDTNYYLWRLESCFKFNANHRVRYIFDGNFHNFTPSDSLFNCWRTSSAKQIFTYSTVNLNEPVIRSFPLNYVSTQTKELSVRYSLLVRQLSINQEAYRFWSSIDELEAESGSMFTKQPYQIRGNVTRMDLKSEPVLGYFLVAGISEKRIFIDRPQELDFYYQYECNLITDDLMNMLWLMYDQWPVLLAGKITTYGHAPALVADKACLDCRLEYEGASITEPPFWVE